MGRLFACAAVACFLSGCSTTLDLGSNDAGVPYDADCRAGTYAGNYSCTTTSSSLLSLSGSGPITITLVPAGAQTLALTPDASLSSGSSGTTSTSALSGVLDCATRKLTGADTNVVFVSPTFSGTVSGSGMFSAIYDPDASPPALIQGVIVPPPSLEAMCTWTAMLQ